jgi:hypothetical protein
VNDGEREGAMGREGVGETSDGWDKDVREIIH